MDPEFDEPGIDDGCAQMVGQGVIAQLGWNLVVWSRRIARPITPYSMDVTSVATPGSTIDVSYHATQDGDEPTGNRGNIVHNSWLVIHK